MRGAFTIHEWLPTHRETQVFAVPAAELLDRLRSGVSFSLPRDPLEEPFWGWIRDNRFKISPKVRRPTPYMPVIVGTVEPTRTGAILFLRFQLLPTTRLFLVFWSLLITLGTAVVSFQYQRISYALGGVAMLIFIHAVVWGNFNLQRKIARERLMHMLKSEHEDLS